MSFRPKGEIFLFVQISQSLRSFEMTNMTYWTTSSGGAVSASNVKRSWRTGVLTNGKEAEPQKVTVTSTCSSQGRSPSSNDIAYPEDGLLTSLKCRSTKTISNDRLPISNDEVMSGAALKLPYPCAFGGMHPPYAHEHTPAPFGL